MFVRVVGTSSFWFPGDFWKCGCNADVTAGVIEHLNVAPVNKQCKRKESLAYCGIQGVLRKYLFRPAVTSGCAKCCLQAIQM